MRLKSFHVRVFRNVIDSGPIEVKKNTCLVGKNEAGKSAILEALDRLNSARPVPLNLLDDYPRWLKKQHEISGEIKDAVPITATFELSPEDVALIEGKLGSGIVSSTDVVVSRKYEGEMKVDVSPNQNTFLKIFTKNVSSVLKPLISSCKTSSELRTKLDEIANEKSEKEPTPESQAAKQSKEELDSILGKGHSLTSAIQGMVTPLIPKTFYFSNYSQLQGRYNLADVIPALEDGADSEEIQAAVDFLKLARITPENVDKGDFEAANAELEAVSSLLTQRVKANWKQNQHLKLAVKIESTVVKQQHIRYLQFRVEDTRHDFSSRLDRWSTGFRWFVSFIASFFEFEGDTNLILLLDEPGLSLHGRAQKDLLDAIDTNLTKGRQVIYSTHSPFMVKTEALDRARIVEDKGPEKGSIVSNDAGDTNDPDTLFPLQAALGYDIAQNLFIGNRNILVEGVSDFIYISVMSSHLSSVTRQKLPEGVRLLPCGGATNIATFIALLGTKLDVVVLLDGNSPRQRIDNAIVEGRLTAHRVLSMDQFATIKGADIEDLFTPEEYLKLYNATFKRSLSKLAGSDRIVKRIERAEGHTFDHGEVAAYFLAHQGKLIKDLSPDTLTRFETAIAALTKALPA
jgi:predicted ATP-dependent endonuclease of OLD family